jgi:hypothetical protein
VGAVREPARHRRGAAVAHRPLQHRQREPVDLEEDDPRRARLHPLAERRAIRCVTRSVYVSSSFVPSTASKTTPSAAAASATSSADQNESTERSSVCDVVGRQEHRRVEHQHDEEAEQRDERQAQRRHERRQNRVQDGDHGRGNEGAAVVVDRCAGHQPRRAQQREGGHRPGKQEAKRPDLRAADAPLRPLAVRWCRSASHGWIHRAG